MNAFLTTFSVIYILAYVGSLFGWYSEYKSGVIREIKVFPFVGFIASISFLISKLF